MRSTPVPVMLAVSSAWLKLIATNEMAPRLYTSSGCVESSAVDQGRQVGQVAGHRLDVRELVARSWSSCGLFWPLTMPKTS